MAAPAEGREVVGTATLQDRLKFGLQGIKNSIEKTTAAVADGEVAAEARPASRSAGSKEGGVDQQVNALFAWAEKARKAVSDKVVYDAVPQDDSNQPEDDSNLPDAEKGEANGWDMWAKAASKVKKQVADAAEKADKNLKKGVQKAKSVEWGEPGAMVTKGMSQLADSANSASSVLSEKSKVASQKALELKDKTGDKLNEAKANAGSAASKAKDKASTAASAAKNKVSEAGANVKGAVGGAASLAMNPVKLAQFTGIFFVGMMFITLSFTFIPVLPIAPQKFALLFAIGSLIVMGSLAFLKGPKALASALMQREKLPFSGTYVVSLVGTLVATIILKSFILTAVFGLAQAWALMYFLASYVPGGQAVLNFCGRCTSKVSQKLCVKSLPCRRT